MEKHAVVDPKWTPNLSEAEVKDPKETKTDDVAIKLANDVAAESKIVKPQPLRTTTTHVQNTSPSVQPPHD